MRTITDHIVNGDTAPQLTITVTDEPGAGGANHAYHVDWISDQCWKNEEPNSEPNSLDVQFQNGPIKEHGINGVTQEALLAIVIDRLRSFQNGPFACNQNATALDYCEKALSVLQMRTRDRIARGVEGKTAA